MFVTQKLYCFLLIVFSFYGSFAQNDTLKKQSFFDNSKGFEVDAKLTMKNLEIDNNGKVDISYLFYSKTKPSRFNYKLNPKKYLNPQIKNSISMQGLEEEKNVIVVKHFNGNNTTEKKFKTSQNLGTITSNTKYIRIEYKDFGLVDGDRVRVFLNEKEIDGNVHLSGLYYTLHIKLEEKGYNKIDIQAINQGYAGPNTAEFIVYDDKGNMIAHKAWNLKKGAIATLGVVKY